MAIKVAFPQLLAINIKKMALINIGNRTESIAQHFAVFDSNIVISIAAIAVEIVRMAKKITRRACARLSSSSSGAIRHPPEILLTKAHLSHI
jgi:hypothetical protein